MSRLIDADALMKELEREVELADDWKTAHEIANVVKYFPTIEPQRMRGRWIPTEPDEPCFYQCSICRRLNDEKDNFCKNCGAKMEGTE